MPPYESYTNLSFRLLLLSSYLHRFFSQTKYPSFQRQLNLYGFSRFAHGRDKGAYYHPCFIRGKPSLVRGMIRRKIKGTKVRRTMHPSEEPDFYDPEWNNNNNNTAAVVVAAAAQDNDVEPPCTHPSSQLEQHKKEILQQQQQQQRPVVVTKVAPTVIDEDRKVAAPKVARKKTTETTATTKKNKTSTRQDSPSTTILPVDMILDDDFKIPDIADTFDRMDRSLLSDNDDVNGLPVSDFDFLGFLDNDDDVREDNNDPLLVWDMNFTSKPTMFAI